MSVHRVIVADAENGPDSEILVPWWSFTKTVLAAGALILVGQNRLDLDAPLGGKPYSLRHLLQHTSGLPDYGTLSEYHAAVAAGEKPWQREEVLRRVKSNDLLFAPGTSWAYSNVGFLFVREIVEQIMRADLDRALHTLVFDPLGAKGVFIAKATEDLDGTTWGNKRQYHPGWVYHGLIVGPAATAVLILDRLLYSAFLSDELRVQLLSAVSLGRTFPRRPAVAPGYGLGLMIDSQSPLGRMVGHTGQGPGSTVAIYSFPDLRPHITLAAFAPEDGADAQGNLEADILALAAKRQARRD